MRHLSLLLILVFLGGLAISSQALSFSQTQQGETLKVAVLTDEELSQWHMANAQPQTVSQVQVKVLTCEQVREMQALLNQRGYYVSSYECDGIGNETMAAIENFQRDQGLVVTGLPNDETLRVLVNSPSQSEFFGISPEFGDDDEGNTLVFGNDDECIAPVYCDEDQ